MTIHTLSTSYPQMDWMTLSFVSNEFTNSIHKSAAPIAIGSSGSKNKNLVVGPVDNGGYVDNCTGRV